MAIDTEKFGQKPVWLLKELRGKLNKRIEARKEHFGKGLSWSSEVTKFAEDLVSKIPVDELWHLISDSELKELQMAEDPEAREKGELNSRRIDEMEKSQSRFQETVLQKLEGLEETLIAKAQPPAPQGDVTKMLLESIVKRLDALEAKDKPEG